MLDGWVRVDNAVWGGQEDVLLIGESWRRLWLSLYHRPCVSPQKGEVGAEGLMCCSDLPPPRLPTAAGLHDRLLYAINSAAGKRKSGERRERKRGR